jgi:ribonuclease HII
MDEVGRGPLAGPVVAAAAIVTYQNCPPWLRRRIQDSKKLAPPAREEIAQELRARIPFAIGAASVTEIDRINILQASFLAMRRALDDLEQTPEIALVDGNRAPELPGIEIRTIVAGDDRSLSIAAASILAKVHRDRLMRLLAHDHPGYEWETNVGYATPAHLEALSRLGPTIHHRISFHPISQLNLPFI